MNLTAFLQTWRGIQAENRWHRLLVLVLVVINLLAWVTASRREVAVVLAGAGAAAGPGHLPAGTGRHRRAVGGVHPGTAHHPL